MVLTVLCTEANITVLRGRLAALFTWKWCKTLLFTVTQQPPEGVKTKVDFWDFETLRRGFYSTDVCCLAVFLFFLHLLLLAAGYFCAFIRMAGIVLWVSQRCVSISKLPFLFFSL